MTHCKIILIWRGNLHTEKTEDTLQRFMIMHWQTLHLFENGQIRRKTVRDLKYKAALDAIFWSYEGPISEEDLDLIVKDEGWLAKFFELCEKTTFEIYEHNKPLRTIEVLK